MDLYPAIDFRSGKVVRLARGDYEDQTIYDDDPVAVARRFDAAGARWIHVVDLDAARDGGNPNLSVIEAICANVERWRTSSWAPWSTTSPPSSTP